MSNERPPPPRSVVVEMKQEAPPAKVSIVETIQRFRPLVNSVWTSPEADDVVGVEQEAIPVRIFCPILDLFFVWAALYSLYTEGGWLPDTSFANVLTPGIVSLLPTVVAFRTGKVLYGFRGALVGASITLGFLAKLEVPGILPAFAFTLLCVPLLRLADQMLASVVEGPGLAASLGLKLIFVVLCVLFAILAQLTVVEVMNWLIQAFKDAIEAMVHDSYPPLSALLVEPGKILFSLGSSGGLVVPSDSPVVKASEYMIDANFGPSFGVLAALFMWGPSCLKAGIPIAASLLVLGGAHEVAVPYLLLQPVQLLSLVAGGFVGHVVLHATSAGLTASPVPGSVFGMARVVPQEDVVMLVVYLILSAVVSFIVSWFLLHRPVDKIRKLLRM